MAGTVVAGALGNCVHVAGVVEFLRIAERLEHDTVFLGAAVPVSRFVEEIALHNPEIVGISYRLTPEVAAGLIDELKSELEKRGLANRRFVFGGTPPVCEVAEESGFFEACFSGLENPDEVWSHLKGVPREACVECRDRTLLERLERKQPYPLVRHHFGLPSLEETIAGARRIAEANVLDVISLAPDQNAQESFFRPKEMDPRLDGAGGAPVRAPDDLRAIREAGRCGNYPLFRIYSGTRDLIKWAEMSTETVENAWAAIPLCWYSALDGRSKRSPEDAISENQAAIRWHAERGIPVEVNEAHHWSLRDSHDTTTVVMSYIAAYNARMMGVRHYVAQYMFNSPPGLSGEMDLAKALAQIELVESLHGPDFFTVRQVRAGLLHLSPQLNKAKGQLGASTVLVLAVKPHIIHVVGYCEGDHAASADDVIESCEIVHGVLRSSLFGMPNMAEDSVVVERKEELRSEAETLLNAIRELARDGEDPFASPRVIARAISLGLLDAPHLKGNTFARGMLETRLIDGAVRAVDPSTREPVTESERLTSIAQGIVKNVDETRLRHVS